MTLGLGQIVHVVDFISSATYKVVPLSKTDPVQDLAIVKDPHLVKASPYGWHNGTETSTSTQGNNARVYTVIHPGAKKYFTDGGKDLQFTPSPDFSKGPTEGANRDASVTNLFYGEFTIAFNFIHLVVNMMHDLAYAYGFTPSAGNFQNLNYGDPGKGGDGVIARAQDTSSVNDASFATVFLISALLI